MSKGNVLTEVAWVKTNLGNRTVRDVFLNVENLELDQNVSGFIYGAQMRFFLTIAPIIFREACGRIEGVTPEVVDKVLFSLKDHANLFDDVRPFLQITDDDAKPFKIREAKTESSKLFPSADGPSEAQATFWDFDSPKETLSTEEAVLALLCYYFYGPGTNTKLYEGKEEKSSKLTNGSSALQYKNSVEIIPLGENLFTTIFMNTPKDFTKLDGDGELLPHWADREGFSFYKEDSEVVIPSLWRFSWSANTVYLDWNDDKTLSFVTRGGAPDKWRKMIPPAEKETFHGKTFHDFRQEQDPFYFYKKVEEKGVLINKLHRFSLSSEPYLTVAQWHAQQISTRLRDKWKRTLIRADNPTNVIFLEHRTEGTAQSFAIRYSNVVAGFRDELFPDEQQQQSISEQSEDLLRMRARVRGFFTQNGTMKHIANRQEDMENAYWGEIQGLLPIMLEGQVSSVEMRKMIVQSAAVAFEKVSSSKNTVHIKAHLSALRMIRGMKW